jgi:hypothetical protein
MNSDTQLGTFTVYKDTSAHKELFIGQKTKSNLAAYPVISNKQSLKRAMAMRGIYRRCHSATLFILVVEVIRWVVIATRQRLWFINVVCTNAHTTRTLTVRCLTAAEQVLVGRREVFHATDKLHNPAFVGSGLHVR